MSTIRIDGEFGFCSMQSTLLASWTRGMNRSLSRIRAQALRRRDLSRGEAAMYLGISGSTFDEMRSTGQIEPPRLIKGRKLWDIRDLDMTFDALPRENDFSNLVCTLVS